MSWNDLLNLLLRTVHITAVIAWIGSSFYFIWLDGSLEAADPGDAAVEGRLWMVHSGGFYRVERRHIGPGQMPEHLHWFKWEAAISAMSGVALLVVVYYLNGGLFLIDPAHPRPVPWVAGIGIALPIVGWLVYDGLWRSPLARRSWLAAVVSLALLAGLILLVGRLMSPRAAYIHVGAVLGIIMVANVWQRILPAQQRMIDATREGRPPDLTLSAAAKRRSVHNSYMTFPVLLLMISNHFPALYGSRLNGLVLVLLAIAGVSARHVMIGKPPGRGWALAPALASIAGVFVLAAPPAGLRGVVAPAGSGPAPSFAEVHAIVRARCLACHSHTPSDPTFGAAPGGVSFDDPARIHALAQRIYVRAVTTRTMPLANKTGMSDAERAVVGRWVEHGAPGP